MYGVDGSQKTTLGILRIMVPLDYDCDFDNPDNIVNGTNEFLSLNM
jgi:hypothetical protein